MAIGVKAEIFPHKNFNSGTGQSIANSQFPGQGNALSDDPGTLESVPEVPIPDSTASATSSSTKTESNEEKVVENEKKMSYDMQTQATELRSMSTQTDSPPVQSQQQRSTPRSFSQSALRSGNLDAGKPTAVVQGSLNIRYNPKVFVDSYWQMSGV